MTHRFTGVDSAVCWIVAIAEFILYAIYVVVQNRRARRKMIQMGRLIPTIPVIFVPGGYSSNQVVMIPPQPQGYPQQNMQPYPPYPQQNMQAYPPYPQYTTQGYPSNAPPTGGPQGQDDPPTYASCVEQKKY